MTGPDYPEDRGVDVRRGSVAGLTVTTARGSAVTLYYGEGLYAADTWSQRRASQASRS